eukprot:39856-Eustigmatos_ZCMA.PRE.1
MRSAFTSALPRSIQQQLHASLNLGLPELVDLAERLHRIQQAPVPVHQQYHLGQLPVLPVNAVQHHDPDAMDVQSNDPCDQVMQ